MTRSGFQAVFRLRAGECPTEQTRAWIQKSPPACDPQIPMREAMKADNCFAAAALLQDHKVILDREVTRIHKRIRREYSKRIGGLLE